MEEAGAGLARGPGAAGATQAGRAHATGRKGAGPTGEGEAAAVGTDPRGRPFTSPVPATFHTRKTCTALDTLPGASISGGVGHAQAVANAGPALALSPGPAASQPCDPESFPREARSQVCVKHPELKPLAAVLLFTCVQLCVLAPFARRSLSLGVQSAPLKDSSQSAQSPHGAALQQCLSILGLSGFISSLPHATVVMCHSC